MDTDTLQINGQTFLAVRVAVRSVSYSKDYITRLARQQKVRAVSVGRVWYVDQDSLEQYVQAQAFEAEARSRQLSYQRQLEHQLREKTVSTFQLPRQFQLVIYPLLIALVIMTVGFFSGAQLSQVTNLASVVTFDSGVVIQDDTTDLSVIKPIFTEDQVVVVDDARTIITPDTKVDWLRIRYD